MVLISFVERQGDDQQSANLVANVGASCFYSYNSCRYPNSFNSFEGSYIEDFEPLVDNKVFQSVLALDTTRRL